MKIKISLTKKGEWSDCWLETKYIKASQSFNCFIYPTSWSDLYKTDGCVQYGTIRLRKFIMTSREYLNFKEEQYDRHLTKMQKISNFFKRIFAW